jgi:hypothetical protein
MTEDKSAKRGSNGGKMRAANLSKEERSAIASAAAKARWERKKQGTDLEKLTVKITEHPVTLSGSAMQPAIIYGPAQSSIPDAPEEKHCPACLAGESLEEGEGTHILATIEHPVTLPAAFQDAEAAVVVPEPPAPPKATKRQAKPMPKEFKTASSYAEKRLPVAIKEKSEHVGAVARLDVEINDLVRVIKALGGNPDTQGIQPQPYLPPSQQGYQLPPVTGYLPPAQAAATQFDIPSPPRPMRGGRAGVADSVIQEFQREIAEG